MTEFQSSLQHSGDIWMDVHHGMCVCLHVRMYACVYRKRRNNTMNVFIYMGWHVRTCMICEILLLILIK